MPHQFRHSLGFLPGFRNKPSTPPDNLNHWFARNGIWQEGEDFSAFNVRDENGNLVGGLNLLGFPKPPPWDQPSIANRNFNDTTPWFYPWLGWFNRPYMNPMELLQVPASSPSRFLREFDPNSDRDPYDAAVPPFVHLQNFFHTNTGSPQAPLAPRGLHRLFDFIETPSRFHGSKLFDAAGNAHPRFRDPGRVNINTIFDDGDTWAALFNLPLKNPELENHWRETWGSRQGFGDFEASGEVVVGRLRVNDNYPTFFRKPFRAFNHYGDTPYSSFNPSEEIHSTVFRKHPRPAGASDRPLLASKTVKEPNTNSVFAANSPYFDGDRHPYFRYQPLARIANNYSTTSNVYAIWITVGYFEAEPVPRSDIHPDGFQYGRELGFDTGEAVRHRAFYIFDRSIPMGFVRGEDLNTEQGVLVRRIIE